MAGAACCPRGHWSPPTGECIQIPGTYGPRCDNVSRFDVDANLSRVDLERVAHGEGNAHVPCTAAPFTSRALRSYLETWLTRTHRARLHWHHSLVGAASKIPTTWRGCFGWW